MNDYKNSTGIIIKNKLGKILFLKRKDNNLWTLPGGKVDEGESILDCAIRELKEETGIENIQLDKYMNKESLTKGQKWKETIFIGEVDDSYIPYTPEKNIFTEIVFFNTNQIPELKEIEEYDHIIIKMLKK